MTTQPDAGTIEEALAQTAVATAAQADNSAATAPAVGNRELLLGTLAALSAILIWAFWFVATRYGMHGMDANVVAVTRFLPAVVVFFPTLLRTGLLPRGVSRPMIALMVIGAGAPYFFAAALALRYAPAAEVAPLLPGTMPLIVALIAVVWQGQRLGRIAYVGFALILAGGFSIAGYRIIETHSFAIGHLFALSGATLWALYVFAFRRSGLTGVQAAALVGAWSAIFCLPTGTMPLIHAFAEGAYRDLLIQFVAQGIGSGIVALVLFNYGIKCLGPARGSAFTALVPALAALLAIPFLGEWPEPPVWLGIAAVSFGVLFVNWPFQRAKT